MYRWWNGLFYNRRKRIRKSPLYSGDSEKGIVVLVEKLAQQSPYFAYIGEKNKTLSFECGLMEVKNGIHFI